MVVARAWQEPIIRA